MKKFGAKLPDDVHPYEHGYSVLPALKLVSGPFFLDDSRLKKERQLAAKTQQVWLEHEITSEVYEPVCKFIAQEAGLPHASFQELASQLAEDVIIHRMQNGKDWMAAGHVCLPSSWWPEEKIGRSFREIHLPIPGMNLNSSEKLVQTIIERGPYERYVWSIIHEDRLNFHPALPRKKFNPESDQLYVKVERQMTVGFPQVGAVLFILRQELIQPEKIKYDKLYLACINMTPAEREYKDVSDELLDYLKARAQKLS